MPISWLLSVYNDMPRFPILYKRNKEGHLKNDIEAELHGSEVMYAIYT